MDVVFPINGTGQCYNSTDCNRGGKCIIITPSGDKYCRCPILYDPLDRCDSFYYDRSGITVHLVHFLIVLVANGILVALIRSFIKKEVMRIYHKGCAVPKPMVVAIISILLLAINNVTVALQYVFRDVRAERVQAVGVTLFCITFIIVKYFFIVLQIKTKRLGTVEMKWRVISIFIVVCGVVGLSLSLITGFFVDQIDRPILGTIGQIIGLILPLIICIGMEVYSIVWISKLDHKSSNSMIIVWRLLWISIASSAWMCISYFTLLLFNQLSASLQLFGNITILNFIVTALFIVAQSLSVAFLRNTRRKKQATLSNPELIPTTDKTPKMSTSSTAVMPSEIATPDDVQTVEAGE